MSQILAVAGILVIIVGTGIYCYLLGHNAAMRRVLKDIKTVQKEAEKIAELARQRRAS
jgi:hypothetical protein